MQRNEIHAMQGDNITTSQNIGEKAVNIFKEQFNKGIEANNYDMLKCIPQLIEEEENTEMERIPIREEVK